MRIAYVGPFEFPSSNANSLRVLGIAEALASQNNLISICSGTSTQAADFQFKAGITVSKVDEYSGWLSKISRGIRGLFLGNKTIDWLKTLSPKPEMVILYGTHLGYLLRLLRYTRRNNILLVLDVVEWYDPRHLPLGPFGPFAFANEIAMRFVAAKADGLIVISKFLQNHFQKKGCATIRIPPIFANSKNLPVYKCFERERTRICYVGSPGKKEDLSSIINGLQLAKSEGARFRMEFVGSDIESLERQSGVKLNGNFEAEEFAVYGRVTNEEARNFITSCDFTILLRKDLRFTKAGFPSKVAESLTLGIPVISNLTSDLRDYLVDSENSIVVEKSDPKGFAKSIARACALSPFEIENMKVNALKSAANFSIEKFALSLNNFCVKLKNDRANF